MGETVRTSLYYADEPERGDEGGYRIQFPFLLPVVHIEWGITYTVEPYAHAQMVLRCLSTGTSIEKPGRPIQ